MTIVVNKIRVASSTSDDFYMITLTAIELEYMRKCLEFVGNTTYDWRRTELHMFGTKCAGIINEALVANGD